MGTEGKEEFINFLGKVSTDDKAKMIEQIAIVLSGEKLKVAPPRYFDDEIDIIVNNTADARKLTVKVRIPKIDEDGNPVKENGVVSPIREDTVLEYWIFKLDPGDNLISYVPGDWEYHVFTDLRKKAREAKEARKRAERG